VSIFPEGSWGVFKVADGDDGERFLVRFIDSEGMGSGYSWSDGPTMTESDLRTDLERRGASVALIESCFVRAREHWRKEHQ